MKRRVGNERRIRRGAIVPLIAVPELKFKHAAEHNVTACCSSLGNTAQFHCGFEYESKVKRVDTHGRVEFEEMPLVSWHLLDTGFAAEGKHFSMSKISQIFLQLAHYTRNVRLDRCVVEMDVFLDEAQCACPGKSPGIPRMSPLY